MNFAIIFGNYWLCTVLPGTLAPLQNFLQRTDLKSQVPKFVSAERVNEFYDYFWKLSATLSRYCETFFGSIRVDHRNLKFLVITSEEPKAKIEYRIAN